jgi:hypothetical protein
MRRGWMSGDGISLLFLHSFRTNSFEFTISSPNLYPQTTHILLLFLIFWFSDTNSFWPFLCCYFNPNLHFPVSK